jgi:hypothetical protein
VVESYLNGFLDEAVHVSWCCVPQLRISLSNRAVCVSYVPFIWPLQTSQSGQCILSHTHGEYDKHRGFWDLSRLWRFWAVFC